MAGINIPKLKEAECGNCGNKDFKVFQQEGTTDIICQCTNCKDNSIITVTKPQITIEFGEGSKGHMHFNS